MGKSYSAFISYRHHEVDRAHAIQIQEGIERYSLPWTLARRLGVPAKLPECYRDEVAIPASSDLSREIDEALKSSRSLIVVCSPRTPESKWINAEVERFRELGRGDRILACVIEGDPEHVMPEALLALHRDAPDILSLPGSRVPAAADMRPKWGLSEAQAHRSAILRLVAGMFGIGYDDLVRRDLWSRRLRVAGYVGVILLLVLITAWGFSQEDRADEEIGKARRSAAKKVDEAERVARSERDTAVARKLADAAAQQLGLKRYSRAALLAKLAYRFSERGGGRARADVDPVLRRVLAVPEFGARIWEPAGGEAPWIVARHPAENILAIGGARDAAKTAWRDPGFVGFLDLRGNAEPEPLPNVGASPIWMSYSPHGTYFAACDYYGEIRIWRAAQPDAEPVRAQGHRLTQAAFSPDERWLAFVGSDRRARLLRLGRTDADVRTLEPRMPETPGIEHGDFAEHDAYSPFPLAFSPDGSRLAACARSVAVYLWDVAAPERPARSLRDPGDSRAIHFVLYFESDARVSAVDENDGDLRTWAVADGRLVSTRRIAYDASDEQYSYFFPTPDRRWILGCGELPNAVKLFDVAGGRHRVLALDGHNPTFGIVDGRNAYTAGYDGVVAWRIEAGASNPAARLTAADLGHDQSVGFDVLTGIVSMALGRNLVALGLNFPRAGGEPVALLPLDDLRRRPRFPRIGSDGRFFTGAGALALHPHDRLLVLAQSQGALWYWDCRDLDEPPEHLATLTETPLAAAFAAKGDPLAVLHARGVFVQEMFTDELRTHRLSGEGLCALALAPDGRFVAAAADDGRIVVWEPGVEAPVAGWQAHEGPVRALAFGDAYRIASCAVGEVCLWTHTGQRLVSLGIEKGTPHDLALRPDGRQLVVALGSATRLPATIDLNRLEEAVSKRKTTPGSIQVYDLRPEFLGNAPVSLSGPERGFTAVAYHPDGKSVLGATESRELWIWNADTDDLARTVSGLARGRLTPEQWAAVLGADVPYEGGDD